MASQPEQHAASVLIPLGFIDVSQTVLRVAFADKDGQPFDAAADFYHPGLDLYVEIKHSFLNGATSKANAERAYHAVHPAKRSGRQAAYFQTRYQWNHAAPKQAIVQAQLSRQQYAIVFTAQPDDATLDRIIKQGIEAYSLARFASMIKLQQAFS